MAVAIDGTVRFKRRGEANDRTGASSTAPTRLLFAVDVSGSMYRFNGQDGRLERLLESTMMVPSAADPPIPRGSLLPCLTTTGWFDATPCT